MVGKNGAGRRGNTDATSGVHVYWAYSIRSRFIKFLVKFGGLTIERAKNTGKLETGRS